MPEILGTTPEHFGTWLDGAQGWHNTYRVVDVAVGYGFTVSRTEAEYLDAYRKGEGEEWADETGATPTEVVAGQGGMADAATEFLNSLCAEGAHFEWDMGELSLMHDEDEDEI